MIKKNLRQRVRPECSKLSQLYRIEGYLTSGTDELNDKQGKIKKKSKWLCNLGPEQREVPRFKPTAYFISFIISLQI